MQKLFEICFYTGAFFTVASFFLSQIGHFHGIGGHSEVGDISGHGIEGHGHGIGDGHDMNIDHGSDAATETISPFKPTVLFAFITTFGGVGMILGKRPISPLLILAGALASGLVVGFLLYRFVIVPLYKAQNTSSVSERYLKGIIGKMDLGTVEKTYGKVSYIVNGNTMTAPALSWNGEEIPKGKTVVIVDIKENTFYVKEIKGVD